MTQLIIPQNEQEAWVAIAYSCLVLNKKKLSFSEIERLCHQLVIKSHFKGHNIPAYLKKSEASYQLLGSKQLIERCCFKISEKNKAILFASVLDIILIRGKLNKNQEQIIAFLSKNLKLDQTLSTTIRKILLIKNKGNTLTDLIK